MDRTTDPRKDSRLNLRVDACHFEEAKRQDCASEARRQSQMIAESEDETEVMRWIQDVSAAEGGQ
jgi:hypothetical protein